MRVCPTCRGGVWSRSSLPSLQVLMVAFSHWLLVPQRVVSNTYMGYIFLNNVDRQTRKGFPGPLGM